MPKNYTSGLDRILGRVENLDETNLTILVQRLVRDRRLLETVFDIIRDGILVVDSKNIIQYANDAAYQLLGLRQREIGKSNIWRRFTELSQALQIHPEDELPDDFSASCEVEIRYPETRFFQVYMVPLQSGQEHELGNGMAVVFTNVTEMKHSTQERIENEKIASIMMLAAGVAHELGNPLNSIHIHLQLLQRQLGQLPVSKVKGKMEKSVEVCSREVERLDGIITQFLAAIRPQQPDIQKVDLLDILSEVLELESHAFQKRGIEVIVDLDADIPPVLGDRNQLKQVFFNILKNAVEAMPAGGQLRVRWKKEGQYVYLLFIDTGEGIDPEDLSKVFQPYFTTKEGGNGLGMMIVQRIMKDHRGNIAIDSRPGKGTVVTLQIPLDQPEKPLLEDLAEIK